MKRMWGVVVVALTLCIAADEEVTIVAQEAELRLTAPALGLADVRLEHAGDARFRAAGRPELGGFTFVFAGVDARASDLRGHAFVGARVE